MKIRRTSKATRSSLQISCQVDPGQHVRALHDAILLRRNPSFLPRSKPKVTFLRLTVTPLRGKSPQKASHFPWPALGKTRAPSFSSEAPRHFLSESSRSSPRCLPERGRAGAAVLATARSREIKLFLENSRRCGAAREGSVGSPPSPEAQDSLVAHKQLEYSAAHQVVVDLVLEQYFPANMGWKVRVLVEDGLCLGVRDVDLSAEANFALGSHATAPVDDERTSSHGLFLTVHGLVATLALYQLSIQGTSPKAKVLSSLLSTSKTRINIEVQGEWELPISYSPTSGRWEPGAGVFRLYVRKDIAGARAAAALPDSIIQFLAKQWLPSMIASAVVVNMPPAFGEFFSSPCANSVRICGKVSVKGDVPARAWQSGDSWAQSGGSRRPHRGKPHRARSSLRYAGGQVFCRAGAEHSAQVQSAAREFGAAVQVENKVRTGRQCAASPTASPDGGRLPSARLGWRGTLRRATLR